MNNKTYYIEAVFFSKKKKANSKHVQTIYVFTGKDPADAENELKNKLRELLRPQKVTVSYKIINEYYKDSQNNKIQIYP